MTESHIYKSHTCESLTSINPLDQPLSQSPDTPTSSGDNNNTYSSYGLSLTEIHDAGLNITVLDDSSSASPPELANEAIGHLYIAHIDPSTDKYKAEWVIRNAPKKIAQLYEQTQRRLKGNSLATASETTASSADGSTSAEGLTSAEGSTQVLSQASSQRASDGGGSSPSWLHFEHDGQLFMFYFSQIQRCLRENKTLDGEQKIIGSLLRKIQSYSPSALYVHAQTLTPEDHSIEILWQFLFYFEIAVYPLPQYKSSPQPQRLPTGVYLHPPKTLASSSEPLKEHLKRTSSLARSNNWVRHVMVEPANLLTPASFVDLVQKRSSQMELTTRFYPADQLKQMGAHAFCAVAGAHPNSGAGILEITYEPTPERRLDSSAPLHRWNKITFVGKGVTYDTGGINVKPSNYMRGMKNDMGGASVAFAMIQLAHDLQWGCTVHAYLAIADNLISTTAFKPDDVVRSLNGVTIEVVHSDAEGRMMLADTLALATRSPSDLVIDFATLTGSSVAAISRRYISVFTNKPAWHPELIKAGQSSGERVWPFPLDDDFNDGITSVMADTLQCPASPAGAGHIAAAMFLKKFIPPTQPWIHLDLSSIRTPSGPSGANLSINTGHGPRWAYEFLTQHHPEPHSQVPANKDHNGTH